MDSLVNRIATRYITGDTDRSVLAAEPVEGPMTAYEDWLDNNPAMQDFKHRTLTPILQRKLVTALNLRAQPRAMRLFALLDQVHHMSLGAPIENLLMDIRLAAQAMGRAVIPVAGDVKGAEIANDLADFVSDSAPALRRIGSIRDETGLMAARKLFADIGIAFVQVVEKMAAAVNLSVGHQIRTVDGMRWPTIKIMTRKEEQLKTIQENNPKLYEEIQKNLGNLGPAQQEATKKVIESGQVPTTVDIEGVPVPAGENYVSSEKTIYLPDGAVMPESEYRRSLTMKRRKESLLTSEFHPMAEFVKEKGGWKSVPVRRPEDLELEGVRKVDVSEAALADPTIFPAMRTDGKPNEIDFRALTDDKSVSKGTRIYPTRENADGDPVIVDGRFKGFLLDDMVNSVGRVVEGVAFDLDDNGLPVAFETRDAEGNLTITVNKEPYVTVDSKGRFLLKIPRIVGGKDPFTRARTNMGNVSSKREVVKIDKATKERKVTPGRAKGTSILEMPSEVGKTLFTFEAQDFATVRRQVGGMCLSGEAAKKIRDYYAQRARQEDALRKENLKSYSLERIGGFKTVSIIDPDTNEPYDPPKLTKDLMSKQKEALSWIETKGYRGLAALDTGVGKTLLCIATMQKMIRDGAAKEGSRFLYVSPRKLKGNLPRELQAWMTEEAAKGLLPRVDNISYEEFTFKVMGGRRAKRTPVKNSERLEKIIDPITKKPIRDPNGKLVYRPIPGTERTVPTRVKKLVKDKQTGEMVEKTVSVSEKVDRDPNFGRDYAAIFFDEAQALVKNENSNRSKAAQIVNHPRKILLTASPMEDDPDELYVGVAITNNQILASGLERDAEGNLVRPKTKLSQARKDLMAFRRRFCVRVAGRTMGIKPDSEKDPTARQDFDAWAKDGMYFADKTTIGIDGTSEEEQKLKIPEKQPNQAVCLTMDPEVEIEYMAAAKGVAKVLKALTAVYYDKVEKLPAAQVKLVERYQVLLKGYMTTLDRLSNAPDEVLDPETGQPKFPGMSSPKIVQATKIVQNKIDNGGKRTLLFTDDPKLAVKTAVEITKKTPDMRVAVALTDRIVVYVNGSPQDRDPELPKENTYTQRAYQDRDGKKIPREEWATFVLREVIGGDPSIKALILTRNYSLGQNLQMFSTVVHLDRDNFSSEMMKQRLARAWRTGQKEPVEEFTLDTVYDTKEETSDPTLDEIRKYIQEAQEDVFNDIVHDSRKAIIGEEWRSMGDTPASMMTVNRKLFELALAPYPAALAEHDYQQAAQGS